MTPTPNTQNLTPSPASPIRDLTYRTYDGPLHARKARWWIIAIARMRYLRAKWWFWLLVVFSLLPYFGVGVVLYIQSTITQTMPSGPRGLLFDAPIGERFATIFFTTQGFQMFFLFLIALAAGAGSIALDNRTNALQVYLSKPLTKGDYLMGKWMGIFLTVFYVALAPALLFYLYCLLNYWDDGFFKNEPWLILRILAACAIPGAVHASLLVGFSAWSKTPLIAGVVYAALYFVTSIGAGAVWAITTRARTDEGVLVRHMHVQGIITGLAQNAYNVSLDETQVSGRRGRRRRDGGTPEMQIQGINQVRIPPPEPAPLILAAFVTMAAGITAARYRIRAVEVVRG